MSRATPHILSIARCVLDAESRAAAETQDPAAFPAMDRLRPRLAALMGNGGVVALFARSLALARAELPWLSTARVNQGGVFEGLEVLSAERPPDDFAKGLTILLAQTLGLLVAFIGPSLTSRLIGEVWPHVPSADRDFGRKEDREKAE